jgi:methylmalonyl-CoA/ethylmalonyl-CoA epimerase
MSESANDSEAGPEPGGRGRGNEDHGLRDESGARTETSSAGLTEVGQIAITVDDVDRATAFYRDVLGVPFLFAAPGLAFFDLRGTRLMLSRPNGVESASSILYFRAADIQQAYETLLGHGVEFSQAPHVVHRTDAYELSMAFFSDNEGNSMALMHETGVI